MDDPFKSATSEIMKGKKRRRLQHNLEENEVKKATTCLVVLVCLLISAGVASAWEIVVENPTDYKVRIKYRVRNGQAGCTSSDIFPITPRSTSTFRTGPLCPDSIFGQIRMEGQWYNMKGVGCAGNDISGEYCGGCCCWNIKYAVCQKAGMGYSEHRDYDFGFCKK